MRWRCDLTSLYSQIEKVLNNLEESTKITGKSHDDDRSLSSWKSYSYSKQYAILQKSKELLELLKDEGRKSNSICKNEQNDLKDVALQDVCECCDMSLTLANAEYQLENTDDSDGTKYFSDMEITCIESSFSKTPTATVRSILKSAQAQRSESARRRVRFEDELEETLGEIIEDKENLNWGANVAVVEKSSASVKTNTNGTQSPGTIRSHRAVSRGKTIETWKILSRHDQPRNSWSSFREKSADLKALRDIKTLVEIENERRQNLKRNSKIYCDDDGVESIKTPARAFTESSLSLIPDDMDIAGLSWTLQSDIGLDSSISFE